MTQQTNPERIRLRVAFRNMFYTTIYAAVEGGFLAAEGLDIDFSHIPTGQSSTDLLKSGDIDITQSGISRSFMDLDAGSDSPPLHIAEINQRDGFFLLSKRPTDGWTWADLVGATLIPVGFTPVPYTTLQAAMRWHGVDPASINLMGGLSAEEMLARFRNGDADYLQVPYPICRATDQRRRGPPRGHARQRERLRMLQQLRGDAGLCGSESRHRAAVRQRLRAGATLGLPKRTGGSGRMHRAGVPRIRQVLAV